MLGNIESWRGAIIKLQLIIALIFISKICLSQNCPLTYSVITTQESCSGCCDGSAYVVVFDGGCAPFNYHWSTGITADTIWNVCAGQYSVTISDVCCLYTTANWYCGSASVNLTKQSQIEKTLFYPNPVISLLNVELPYSLGALDNEKVVIVYNALGQIALKQNINAQRFNLDVSEFEKGIYLVTIVDNNIVQFSKKFIKE